MSSIEVSNKAAVCLLLLLGLSLTARSLDLSRRHLIPFNDEVAYLDLARDFAERGGVLKTVRDYATGVCRDDKRHPLYLLLLTPLMQKDAQDFANAKLVTLSTALFLLGLVFFLARRQWGTRIALVSAAMTALSPATARLSADVIGDVLFSAFYFSAVMLIIKNDRLRTWGCFGAAVGLAYLSKGSGYFLFVSAVACGLWSFRLGFFKKPHLYIALGTFLFVAGFLLLRNTIVWHHPLYNFNNKIFWIDSWRDSYFMAQSPEWDSIGLKWFLSKNDLPAIAARFVRGFQAMTGLLIMAAAVGPLSKAGTFITGCLVVGFALVGLTQRWRSGHQREVWGIGSVAAVLFLLFSFQTAGVDNQWRYAYPIAITFFPMAIFGVLQFLPSTFRSDRFLTLGLAMLATVYIGVHRSGFAVNPLNFWAVPGFWNETSSWIQSHGNANGFLINNASRYSTWDCCRDQRKIFPYDVPADVLQSFVRSENVSVALVDQSVLHFDPFQEKYGVSDAHGPLTFIGWPRCFHDTAAPSHFLIYARSCPSEGKSLAQ